MISSMTAFGRTQKETSGYSITVEVRTLNGRGLDIVPRLPKNFLEFEDACRKLISQSLRRGRVEVFVQIESTSPELKAPRLNLSLARHYWEQLMELHRSLPTSAPPMLDSLLRVPYLFEAREDDPDRELIRELLTGALSEALERVRSMRQVEGESLRKDCLERLEVLARDLALIESRKDLVVLEYQQKIRDRIQELLSDTEIDENRLLQEVAYIAERADINEEIVRLKSHFDQLRELLSEQAPSDGRRLDFLAQELHREVNTIGSKTGDLETVQAVVRMKTEIGKVKEQVQNIE